MLFDLRGRGRRNVIKVVYLFLALLLGGGLVLFGIGGNTGDGGLVNAFTDSSGNPIDEESYEEDIRAARARLQTDPEDETAWVDLIRAQTSLANTGGGLDPETGLYTEAGKADLREAIASWDGYQEIDPANDDEEARIASVVARAYLALEDIEGLVSVQEVVALNREAVGPYSELAQFAYAAGQTRKGDLAAKKALELADPEDREALKGQLDAAKAQAPGQAVPSATPAPSASATATPKGKAKADPSDEAKAGENAGRGKQDAKSKPSGE